MEHSESIVAFASAFILAQAKIEGAAKDKVNPHFKSRYADLSSVMDACKESLNAQGIGIMQVFLPSDPNTLKLETVLLHTSGEWIAGTILMPLPKNDPQGYGSAATYARRYGLAAIVGVCPEDDDGNAESQQQKQATKPTAAKSAAVKPASDKPKELNEQEGKRALDAINAAFQEQHIPPSASIEIIKEQLNAAGHDRLRTAGRGWCKHLIDQIKSGHFDSHQKASR